MPKAHKSGNLRQKNKPFKGKSNAKVEEKQFGIGGIRKKIKKGEKQLNKHERKNMLLQRRKEKESKSQASYDVHVSEDIDPMMQETLTQINNKQPNPPKVVLLASFNAAANPKAIEENLGKLLRNEDFMNTDSQSSNTNKLIHDFKYSILTTSNKISPELKNENFMFISCPRDKDLFLEYCKIADVVCIVLSCKNVDKENLVLDPHEHAKAFDELGYTMLEYMRSQGVPTTVGVLQDLNLLPQNKQNIVKKIYERFYESELGLGEKFVNIEDETRSYINFLRTLQTIHLKRLPWREIRSYLPASTIEVDTTNNVLAVTGYLRGTCLNPNQLVHVTGFGDFQIGRVEILNNPLINGRARANLNTFASNTDGLNILAAKEPEPNKIESLNQFAENKNLQKVVEKDATEEAKLGMEEEKTSEMAVRKNNKEMNLEEKLWDEMEALNIEDQASDVSYNEENDVTLMDMETEKNRLKFKLKERAEDELEFEDERDFQVNINLRDRLQKYTGLKSFRTSEWNTYSGLPPEFEKVLLFDDFAKSQKAAIAYANKNAFAIGGSYIKIYILNFPLAQLQTYNKDKPFVVSSLLRYERKITIQHMSVTKHVNEKEALKSKEAFELHAGFRVFSIHPTFSRVFMSCQKTKMEHKISDSNKTYLASMYTEVTYLPANALMFKIKEDGSKDLVASGELQKSDPLKVTLKRLILTGYPLKIHKRKAIVRMMFFNPGDIHYFKPIELTTKSRLKGHIKESLGTHGLMKCIFSGNIKPNDTVCMHLYKRVFPKWPFPQVDSSLNTMSV